MRLKAVFAFLCAVQLIASAKTDYYVKSVDFPAGATPEQKVEMASRVVPDSRQADWQKLELTAFLHFGPNTFTGREWGDGKESPSVFNPTALDAEQWVRTLKDAGFKLVILTAKHHDGFCLWPTETTAHSVKNSPWKGGKGDVMQELSDACKKYGMKLGVYLSPWDRNSAVYGSEKYNDLYAAQLTELLTKYGQIDEVWFDGACGEGPNGKKQVYDWPRFYSIIEKLQPNAVTAIMGHHVRWVGNEGGQGRETEWSVTPYTPGGYKEAAERNAALGLKETSKDLGSRELVAKADRVYWFPSEVDVSIRRGWFYNDSDKPRSLKELANIYLNSVGRGSVLLLNFPPDRTGCINKTDVDRIREWKQWVDANFTNNLAKKTNLKKLTAKLDSNKNFNAIMVGENIGKGQKVEKFDVEGKVNGKWVKLAEGTTIGAKRILRFDDTKADEVRVKITSSRGEPEMAFFKVFNVTMPQ